MDKNIKLSELIEIGSRKTGPLTHAYVEKYVSSNKLLINWNACALGAAKIAQLGELTEDIDVKGLPSVRERIKHPISQNIMAIKNIVIDLNDEYKWSRSQIAFWLKSIGY